MAEMGPIQYFICGGFGGICTVVVGHPLDTIKVSTIFIADPDTLHMLQLITGSSTNYAYPQTWGKAFICRYSRLP
jgi:hypothetical protein